eukprot:CAMPEP_0175080890 /NCGR_PEP_ID=MMETSP0052_2-20121109/25796_1 /TAXON_ID=51329 ORGANISM="Polytomella parva, Strain SAG 63-3" /NCGR_SAMPLE_ID=MMETSP0052_2 /ASSEMBLY_ACC=CAM_ASM_000194 /LENGTH=37 /DNA_ID= /DNA_START= /DNA_END= /DNA_ORIENTATION=
MPLLNAPGGAGGEEKGWEGEEGEKEEVEREGGGDLNY